MDLQRISLEMDRVVDRLAADPTFGRFIDAMLLCPKPYRGAGEVRVVVIGQDPTVRNPASRRRVRTALNLDKQRSLTRYVSRVARDIGTSLDGLYATNLVKNFFTAPPTTLGSLVLSTAATAWWPLLLEELTDVPGAPVIALGEPVLALVASEPASKRVRDYWGFQGYGRPARTDGFRALEPEENRLGRLVFPLPHQPSLRKQFYKEALPAYLAFVRNRIS